MQEGLGYVSLLIVQEILGYSLQIQKILSASYKNNWAVVLWNKKESRLGFSPLEISHCFQRLMAILWTKNLLGTIYNTLLSFKASLPHNDVVSLSELHISAHRHILAGQQKVG